MKTYHKTKYFILFWFLFTIQHWNIYPKAYESDFWLSESNVFFYYPTVNESEKSYGLGVSGLYQESLFGGGSIWFPTPYSGMYVSDYIHSENIHRLNLGISRSLLRNWHWGLSMLGIFSPQNFYGMGFEPGVHALYPFHIRNSKNVYNFSVRATLPVYIVNPDERDNEWNHDPFRINMNLNIPIIENWYVDLSQDPFYSIKNEDIYWISRFRLGYQSKNRMKVYQNISWMSENYYALGAGIEKDFKDYYLDFSYNYFITETSYHNFELKIGMLFNDQLSPKITMEEYPEEFSPDNNLIKDEAIFRFSVEDMSEIKYWKLTIYNENGHEVRSISSREKYPNRESFSDAFKKIFYKKASKEIPKSIIWNADRNPVEVDYLYQKFSKIPEANLHVNRAGEGQYYYDIYVVDEAGNYSRYNGSKFYLSRDLSLRDVDLSIIEDKLKVSYQNRKKYVFDDESIVSITLFDTSMNIIFQEKRKFEKEDEFSEYEIDINNNILKEAVYYQVKVLNLFGASWEKFSFLENNFLESEMIRVDYSHWNKNLSDASKVEIFIHKNIIQKNEIKNIYLRKEKITEKNKDDHLIDWKVQNIETRDQSFYVVSLDSKQLNKIQSKDSNYYLYFSGDLNLERKIKIDIKPPKVNVKIDKKIFTPDYDGYNDMITFHNKVKDDSKVQLYRMDIYRKKTPTEEKDVLVRTFHYYYSFPQRIIWNGLTSSGYQVSSYDKFYAKIKVVDIWGNSTFLKSPDFYTGLLVFKENGKYKISIQKKLFLPQKSEFINTKENRNIMKDIYESLKLYGANSLTIVVHTSQSGDEITNLKTSEKRAYFLREYLGKMGFNSQKISFIGKGEVDLMLPEENSYYRYLNERITLYFK